MRRLLSMLLLTSLFFAGCSSTPTAVSTAEAWMAPTPMHDGCGDSSEVVVDGPNPVAVLELKDFGTVRVELFAQMAPKTVENFIELAESGFYDDTLFHRIIKDFMMQGGDPNSKDDIQGNEGQGGPGYTIPDEFHYRLRHDRGGLLSMANSGPNTGGSQFFITFGPTPWLNDAHAIFGEVVEGMDIVEDVNARAADSGNSGKPQMEVMLTSITIEHPESLPAGDASVGLLVPDTTQLVSPEGGNAGFLAIAVSCTDHALDATLTVEDATETFGLAAANRAAFPITLEVPAGEAGSTYEAEATVTLGSASATVTLKAVRSEAVGKTIAEGDEVEAHYIGILADGRMFDTSLAEVAEWDFMPKFETFSSRARGDPFTFTPGSGVIEGFTELAVGTQAGGTATATIPPEKGYGFNRQQSPLAGRDLLFSLEVVQIVE